MIVSMLVQNVDRITKGAVVRKEDSDLFSSRDRKEGGRNSNNVEL